MAAVMDGTARCEHCVLPVRRSWVCIQSGPFCVEFAWLSSWVLQLLLLPTTFQTNAVSGVRLTVILNCP